MNRMADVAKMFGKGLNEPFVAVIWDYVRKCKFSDEGLEVEYVDDSNDWVKSDSWLRCLLTGEAVIVDD